MTVLLDANVLVALVVAEHVHHDVSASWLANDDSGFATCPITERSLMRFLVRSGHSAPAARDVIVAVGNATRHEFWPEDVSFADVQLTGVIGHRHVTDAYLAQLARKRKARLVTLDKGLAEVHSDVATLIS